MSAEYTKVKIVRYDVYRIFQLYSLHVHLWQVVSNLKILLHQTSLNLSHIMLLLLSSNRINAKIHVKS